MTNVSLFLFAGCLVPLGLIGGVYWLIGYRTGGWRILSRYHQEACRREGVDYWLKWIWLGGVYYPSNLRISQHGICISAPFPTFKWIPAISIPWEDITMISDEIYPGTIVSLSIGVPELSQLRFPSGILFNSRELVPDPIRKKLRQYGDTIG